MLLRGGFYHAGPWAGPRDGHVGVRGDRGEVAQQRAAGLSVGCRAGPTAGWRCDRRPCSEIACRSGHGAPLQTREPDTGAPVGAWEEARPPLSG